MTAVGPSAVGLSVDALAFVVTGVSLYFVARQKASQYPYINGLLILVHVLFELVVVQDILRNFATSASLVADYSVFAAVMVFVDAALLTVIAYSVYARPGGERLGQRLSGLFLKWPHGLVLGGFIAYIAALCVYVAFNRPFTVVALASPGGGSVYAPHFSNTYLAASSFVLAFFLAYPTLLLVRASLASKDLGVRRNLALLPFYWAGIGAEILVFDGYLVSIGYDYMAVGYAIAALLFGLTAAVFRRVSAISSFFGPLEGIPAGTAAGGTERRSALDVSVPVLLEVDPSSNYESALVSYCRSRTGSGGLVFVFTSRASTVHEGIQGIPGVRFYLMTSQVSYPTSTSREDELLVPQNDSAVLLDLIDKTVSSTGERPIAVVFDSLTELSLYQGFESAYKFLRSANELTDRPRVSLVCLVVKAAHDDRAMSLFRSLFRMQVAYDASGLRVTREPDGNPAA